jgi:hypothetical protein
MLPPHGPAKGGYGGFEVVSCAPLQQWAIAEKFASYQDCESSWLAQIVSRIQSYQKTPSAQRSPDSYIALRALLAGKCVKDSDVRLTPR